MWKSFGLSHAKILRIIAYENQRFPLARIFRFLVQGFCSFLNILRFSKQKPLRNPLEFSGLFYCSVIKELCRFLKDFVIHISNSLFILSQTVLSVKNFFNFLKNFLKHFFSNKVIIPDRRRCILATFFILTPCNVFVNSFLRIFSFF